jgi:DHA1 family bicyclomycin/chloramphenicol resistance-like MFS transporter
MTATEPARVPHPGMRFREFVVLMAAMMALNAIAIDSMLPALPHIGEDLGVTEENSRQWVITAYLLGFGFAQLFLGTLSDRFGRKPVLLISFVIYFIGAIASSTAQSFEILIAARVFQGLGAAASRVLTVSIIRDCYTGRVMAKVMSLAFIVFLIVPILAPSMGQLVMLVGPWRWIFDGLGLFAAVLFVWAAWRLPETLHPEDRRPLEFESVTSAFRTVLTTRISIGYSIAMTFVMGGLFGFINSVQQIFADVFDLPRWFTLIFAAMAGSMAVASFLNSRIVERYGMRRISHTAMFGFAASAALNLAFALSGFETVWSFSLLLCAAFFCFGLTAPNFGAMAMEPVGHIAGTASSVQGFVTVVGGASLGSVIGQNFNGSTVPLLAGFSLLGLTAILVVWITEGQLFRPHARPEH